MKSIRATLLVILLIGLILPRANAIILRDPTQPYDLQVPNIRNERPGLSAIIISGHQRFAVLDGKIVGTGDHVNSNTVMDIQPNSVELTGPGGRVTLFLLNQSVKNAAKE